MRKATFIDHPPPACTACAGTGLRVMGIPRLAIRFLGKGAFAKCDVCDGDGFLREMAKQ